MQYRRNFICVTVADFIVRSAYQIGKTPLLPIFAARLGAPWAFLGFIVSVSTITGMVLKPAVGILSDRWGRVWWLVVGTALFAGVPFLYRFIQTAEELFGIRVIHGLATAIYGPVTLAIVAEQTELKRAEKLGWFGMARQAGYILGTCGWWLVAADDGARLRFHTDRNAQLFCVHSSRSAEKTAYAFLECSSTNRRASRKGAKDWSQYTSHLAIRRSRIRTVYCNIRYQSISASVCRLVRN